MENRRAHFLKQEMTGLSNRVSEGLKEKEGKIVPMVCFLFFCFLFFCFEAGGFQ